MVVATVCHPWQLLVILSEPCCSDETLGIPALTCRTGVSENTITAALRAIGYSGNAMTGHGFRTMARTILDEVLHVRPDYIDEVS